MLYMFRTVLVHHQEQLYKLYIAFGICRCHTCGCCVTIGRNFSFLCSHSRNNYCGKILSVVLEIASSSFPRRAAKNSNPHWPSWIGEEVPRCRVIWTVRFTVLKISSSLHVLITSAKCDVHVVLPIVTQQPHVWYRHIPNAMYSL